MWKFWHQNVLLLWKITLKNISQLYYVLRSNISDATWECEKNISRLTWYLSRELWYTLLNCRIHNHTSDTTNRWPLCYRNNQLNWRQVCRATLADQSHYHSLYTDLVNKADQKISKKSLTHNCLNKFMSADFPNKAKNIMLMNFIMSVILLMKLWYNYR